MRTIKLEQDYGYDKTKEKWGGKFLTSEAYDQVVDSTETYCITKPSATLYDDAPLAYVVTNVFPDNTVRNCLKTIEETTTMRANCSGPILPEDMEGVDYKLRTPNSYHRKTKSGKWGMIAYGNEIHSVMAGWKRGRFTGAIEASGWTKDNPEKFEILKDVCHFNELAFQKIDESRYNAQRLFAETYISYEHRIGLSTTLSMNRYSDLGLGSRGMSVHVDSSDNRMGLTTMCHFREGEYTGAYLCFPRYGIAIDAPDNSVIIADSLEHHGVTSISGEGTRYSCVAYCDVRLATKGQLGKTPKKIGKYSDNANLENFYEL